MLFISWMHSWVYSPTSYESAFIWAAALKILSSKKCVNKIFSDESGIAGLLDTVMVLYKLYGAIWKKKISFFFSHLKSSLLLRLFQENAANLFYCEAPDLFCGLRHFWLNFLVTCSFNESVRFESRVNNEADMNEMKLLTGTSCIASCEVLLHRLTIRRIVSRRHYRM